MKETFCVALVVTYKSGSPMTDGRLRQTLAMTFAQMKSTQHALTLLRNLLETGDAEDPHTKGLLGTVRITA